MHLLQAVILLGIMSCYMLSRSPRVHGGPPLPDGDQLEMEAGNVRVRFINDKCCLLVFRDFGNENVSCSSMLPEDGGHGRNATNDGETEVCQRRRRTHPIKWCLQQIQEVDSDGRNINGNGHSFMGFGNLRCSPMFIGENETVPNSNGEVMAMKATATVGLNDDGAELVLEAYLIKNAGTITQGEERRQIAGGNLKFNIRMTGWDFADNGANLILRVRVDSMCRPQRHMLDGEDSAQDGDGGRSPRQRRFNLCGGAKATFSDVVLVDGEVMVLPEVVSITNANFISVTLPRFQTSLLYDPDTDAGSEEYEEIGDGCRAAMYSNGIMVVITITAAILLTMS